MQFRHSPEIWRAFPELAAGVLVVDGLADRPSVDAAVAEFHAVAASRLATAADGEFPEIQAWRRTFARMGLKPTQYRCAAEALLRRFRKDGGLPRIHPLIDLCNAVSLAFAIPVAAFDLARISGDLEVRHATGAEAYLTFAGETEAPEPGEVIFADAAGRAHARRWSNRQSGHSAIRSETRTALVVAEALHPTARADIQAVLEALAATLRRTGSANPRTGLLSAADPAFTV